MIDGKVVAQMIHNMRRLGCGAVIGSEQAAALSSYIAMLEALDPQYIALKRSYMCMRNTHAPFVAGNLADYVEEVRDVLRRLDEYVAELAVDKSWSQHGS